MVEVMAGAATLVLGRQCSSVMFPLGGLQWASCFLPAMVVWSGLQLCEGWSPCLCILLGNRFDLLMSVQG